MQRAFELGIDVPKTFEGWADFFPRYTTLPWLKGREAPASADDARLPASRFPPGADRSADDRNSLERLVHGMIAVPARWRLDHDVYALSIRTVAEEPCRSACETT